MYLKRLEIRGFKSFADHTELNFDDGINIIVGPNGCGKSNIVDAVRWVLGEANVRSLRGHKNEDVIFNGTDKKRGLGMAQVELTMDNSQGNLPIEYNEITVSRRIFRSGESEFYLNKTRVRMKDIVQLYTDTGLGKKGYSIISQGELERVLNGQPFDRRLMLEEAAGTMRYRQQKDEVHQRIWATAQDLLRVEDILNELRARKHELGRKADKARIYLQFKEEYLTLDRLVMAYQVEQMEARSAAESRELQEKQAELQRISAGWDQLGRRLQEAGERQGEQRARLNQAKDRKHELENTINKMDSEIRLSQERIKNRQERIQVSQQDHQKYRLLLEKIEEDLAQKTADFEQERLLYRSREEELRQLEQEIKDLESCLAVQEGILARNNQQIFDRASRETQFRNAMIDLEDSNKKARERRERLAVRLDESEARLQSATVQIAELQRKRQMAAGSLERAGNAVSAAQLELQSLQGSQAEIENQYRGLSEQRAKLERQVSVWQELQRSRGGYSEGVRALLQAQDRGAIELPGLRGLISELIDVPAGMELAIGTAMGAGLENMVVETSASARRAIQVLKEKRWGRVTFLPLDHLRHTEIPGRIRQELKREAGVLGLADELVQYQATDELAVKYILGRVLLVADLTSGYNIFRKYQLPLRIVTLEGELINTSGAVTGGIRKVSQLNLLERRQEGKAMQEQLDQIISLESANRGRATELAHRSTALENQLAELKRNQAEEAFQLQMIKEEEQRISAAIGETTAERDRCRHEKGLIDASIREVEAQLKGLAEEYQEHHTHNTVIDEQSEKVKAELEITRRDYEVKRERYASYQEQLAMKKREMDNDSSNIAQFSQVRNSYQLSASEAHGLQQRLRSEAEAFADKIEATVVTRKDIQQQLETLVQTIEATRQEYDQLQRWIESADQDAVAARISCGQMQEQIRIQEVRLARLETELQGIQGQWLEKYPAHDISTGDSILSHRQVREYRRRIDELRADIEALGSIDIESIKEYDELRERYDFLNRQTEDLTAAKVSLENLLQETERIMAKNFSEFMVRADESFQRTFQEIFPGGDARLQIEAAHDLAAGVDIVVKMPGKRSQSLNLLSGGERALTCIAFIFALLRIKPSPFCLLDEIDASLDEANLQRFADFLSRMAKDTQFIVITHRPATIEAGSNIYGITMPQEGISSVLSMQYDDARSIAG
ncbi:MAG: chromosome segregation protein SMC [Syntrophomonas sp.]|nr:chromosome segregation protein SMC [Syntrophomonas sp.]